MGEVVSRSASVPIPPEVVAQWLLLAQVLAEHGSAPCQEDAPDLWWPPRGGSPEAVAGCEVCPARAACLAYALAAGEREGIWGGTLPAARWGMGRAAAPCPTTVSNVAG